MTAPQPETGTQEAPDPQSRPRPTFDEIRDLTGLRRTVKGAPEGRHVAGVAGGLARHLDVDPLVPRVALVVSVFFGGAGLILYAAGWLLVPEEGEDDALIPADLRLRTALLWVAAGLAGLAFLGDAVGGVDLPWLWILIGIVVVATYGTRGKWALWHHGMTPAAGGWSVGLRREAPATEPTDPTAPGAPAATDPEALARLHTLLGDPHQPAPTPQRPRPTRRGPVLIGFAIALAALLCGVLGLVDAAGATVPTSAYPALVLTVFAGFLVLGAFWGRATGLAALSLVPLLALGVTTVTGHFELHAEQISLRPTSAAMLRPAYAFQAGQAEIDLTQVPPAQLDGRTLQVTGDVGQIVVVVPEDVAVTASGTVSGPGEVDIFGDRSNGLGGSHLRRVHDGGDDRLALDTALDVGAIRIFTEDDPQAERWQEQIQRDSRPVPSPRPERQVTP